VAPPLQAGVVESFTGLGCMVLQPYTMGGNRLYPEFWVVTGGPWYPGYITPTCPLNLFSLILCSNLLFLDVSAPFILNDVIGGGNK
jgi:hypothetical protein